jgi:hypothetical protein
MNILPRPKKWANIIMGIVVVLVFAYLYAKFYLGGRLYWSYVNATTFYFMDKVCDFAPLIAIVIIVGCVVSQFIQRAYEQNAVRFVFSFIGAIFLTGTLLLASLDPFFAKSPSQLQEIVVTNHMYRLAYFPPAGSGGSYFQLFQCDSLGVFCDWLYRLPAEDFADVTDYPKLAFESKQSRIVLVQYGNVMYEQKIV